MTVRGKRLLIVEDASDLARLGTGPGDRVLALGKVEAEGVTWRRDGLVTAAMQREVYDGALAAARALAPCFASVTAYPEAVEVPLFFSLYEIFLRVSLVRHVLTSDIAEIHVVRRKLYRRRLLVDTAEAIRSTAKAAGVRLVVRGVCAKSVVSEAAYRWLTTGWGRLPWVVVEWVRQWRYGGAAAAGSVPVLFFAENGEPSFCDTHGLAVAHFHQAGLPFLSMAATSKVLRNYRHRGLPVHRLFEPLPALGRLRSPPVPAVPAVPWRGADVSAALVATWRYAAADLHRRVHPMVDSLAKVVRSRGVRTVVVSSDSSPISRALVLWARRNAVASAVIQHSFGIEEYGYIPVTADRMLAWGEQARRDLMGFGTPPDRIMVTGTPKYDALFGAGPAGRLCASRRQVVYVTQNLANDPTNTARLLSDLMVIGCGGDLAVRVHPADDPGRYAAVLDQAVTILTKGDLFAMLAETAVVVTQYSTVAMEAVLAGVPVVLILPEGDGDNVYIRSGVGLAYRGGETIERAIALGASQEFLTARESFLGLVLANPGRAAEAIARILINQA